MGEDWRARQKADRDRKVAIRRQGSRSKGHSYGIIVPKPIAREVAQMSGANMDDENEVWEALSSYIFEAELTEEGILFRPSRVAEVKGWAVADDYRVVA